MKKAQSDIIGMAVIVFLLVFILLIYLIFASQSKPTTSIKEATIANNLMDSLLKLTPECNPSKSIHRILSQYPASYCDMPINEFLNKELSEALEKSSINYGYRLIITINNQDIVTISKNCDNAQRELRKSQKALKYQADLTLCSAKR